MILSRAIFCAGVLALSACSLAPDYQVPSAPTPAAFKEAGDWVEAQPQDAVPRGAWWTLFGDAQLDALEQQVSEANQNLKAAMAQYDQARAAAGIARAAYFPAITADAGATRQKKSLNAANKPSVSLYNDFTFGADLSYEIDLWGRVRNTVAANEDQAEASAADLAGADLSLHAELASDYFALRGDDEALAVLDKTVAADQQAYNLTEQRYKGGIASESDVDQAETQLENAKTQATDMSLQRAELEHAIAILTGKAPADFTLPPAPIAARLPRLHNEIPSVLLQRRPDIAAAERRTAAANAEIGVARAAWFPVFNLSGMIGMESVASASWLNAPSEFWALGSTAAMPLFNGGLTGSLNDQARAAYEQTVANYRQTVLSAYGEVEDNLAALRRLESESRTQAKAMASSERALAQANTMYKEGATTYLDVVSTQNAELQARLATITLQVRRLTASVGLIKALGGGWQPQGAS